MPVISLFSGKFCGARDLVAALSTEVPQRISDADVISEVERRTDLSGDKIRRAFSAKTSVFNQFTHEKEYAVAHLKSVLADMLFDGPLLVDGFISHLIPETVSHVLKVCLVADTSVRVARAMAELKIGEKDVMRMMDRHDRDCAGWTSYLFDDPDPWAADRYDLVIPMQMTGPEDAVALIRENLQKPVLLPSPASRKALADFRLAAAVETSLAREGHTVHVTADAGRVTLTINKHVLMLKRLEKELKDIVGRISGVDSVETEVGHAYHESNIYRQHRFDTPSKVLLVDDEREFVQTLSERLQIRDMGSAVAYDGQSALDIIHDDDPEVMIIDLKMPGIDGLDVLKQVKTERPEIEVIVLTGHGSEEDRQQCMDLGAFAYFQKPVNIDRLSEALKQAHEKIRKAK